MFSTVPLQPEDRERFTFTQGRTQFAFTRLPLGFKHIPSFPHQALVKESEQVPQDPVVTVYEYTYDGGDSPSEVQIMCDRSGNCRALASAFSRVWYNYLTFTWSVKEPRCLGLGRYSWSSISFINTQCFRMSGYGPRDTKTLHVGHCHRWSGALHS